MELIDLRLMYCQHCMLQIGCCCVDQSELRSVESLKFSSSLQRCGFVQIIGHGIDEQIIAQSFQEAVQFFGKSKIVKDGFISKDKARRGYSASQTENFASLIGVAGKPNDLVQKYRIGPTPPSTGAEENNLYYASKEGRIHFFPNNEKVLSKYFSMSSTQYYSEMVRVSKQLLQLILNSSGVPSTSFDTFVDKHTSILSLNYYEGLGVAVPDTDGAVVRVAMHTDVSMLTIVAQSAMQGTAAGALQVFVRSETSPEGEFITVPYIPGSLIVNIGDCLHDWSQGRYPSALHRVVNLPQMEGGERVSCTKPGNSLTDDSRYSLAFFFAPNYNALMHWPGESDEHSARPATDYSTWRKKHIKSSMQQLKKSTA